MKKSKTHYGSIGTEEKFPIDKLQEFVKYMGRWRPIEKDGFGATWVVVKKSGITQFFEIKEYSPEETKELIDLYGE